MTLSSPMQDLDKKEARERPPELLQVHEALHILNEPVSGQLLNDLRLRVLEGWDPDPQSMLQIVNQIRQDRRKAARIQTNANAKAKRMNDPRNKPITKEDLREILDQEIDQ